MSFRDHDKKTFIADTARDLPNAASPSATS